MSDVPVTAEIGVERALPAAHADSLVARLGVYYAWAMPLVACVCAVPGLEVGGLRLSGWLWVLLMLLGFYLLFVADRGPAARKVEQPCRPWLAWIGFFWLSLLWYEGWGRADIQQALQMTTPLLVAAVSSKYIRTDKDLRILISAFGWSLVPIAVSIYLIHFGVIDDEGQVKRALALTVALIGSVFLGEKSIRGYAGGCICLALILLSESRMAAVALVLVILLHPNFKGWRRLLAVGIMVLCGLVVFYSPTFQERTFHGGGGSISDLSDEGEVDSEGRFDAWPQIYDEAWKRPVLGHGVGAARDFTLSVWPGMEHPHNDYLRIGFEGGLVGLAIYLFASFWQLKDLHRKINVSDGIINKAFVGAYLGLLVMLISSMTDNTLVYNVPYTNPLFALIGGAYGALSRSSETCAT